MLKRINTYTQLFTSNNSSRLTLSCSIIAVVVFFTFLPSLNNGFTNWDDDVCVVNNPDIKGFSCYNIIKLFSSSYVSNYQPLTMLTYMAEYSLFKLNPRIYHTTNLVLHIVNACLVVFLIYGLSGSGLSSLLVGFLFAIHPMRVESVAWIAERKDVLSAFFYFLSLLFYLRHINKNKRKYYWYSTFALLFSLLSKPMAVSQPFILLLIDFLKNKKIDKKSIINKIPFFALSIMFSVTTLFIQLSYSKPIYIDISIFNQIFASFFGIVFYLAKTVIPTNLCAFYPFPSSVDSRLSIIMTLSFLVASGIFAAIWFFRKKSKRVVFGFLFFIITALPVLQLVRIGNAIAADRYTYIPLLGIYFIFAEWITFLYKEKTRNNKALKTLLIAGITLPLLCFVFMTQNQCRIWKDSFTLWKDAIIKHPSATAYTMRGAAYYNSRNYERAIEDHTRAITINPSYAQAYNNRGLACFRKGDFEQAIRDYSVAIKLAPYFVDPYCNRGIVFCEKGDYNRAIIDHTHAISINPTFAEAYINRGAVYYRKGDYDRAVKDFSAAIKISPFSIAAYCNRGMVYCDKGDYNSAIEDYTKALRFDPGNAQANNSLGIAYFRKGDYNNAIKVYSEAIKVDHSFSDAYSNRGQANYYKGDYDLSIQDFTKAIMLNPQNASIYFNRGLVYETKGAYIQAIGDLKKACDMGFGPACQMMLKKQ
jgi:protein O-mannosyl-transferase